MSWWGCDVRISLMIICVKHNGILTEVGASSELIILFKLRVAQVSSVIGVSHWAFLE